MLGCPESLPDPWTLAADLEHAFHDLRDRSEAVSRWDGSGSPEPR
jgi:hypothetical protein